MQPVCPVCEPSSTVCHRYLCQGDQFQVSGTVRLVSGPHSSTDISTTFDCQKFPANFCNRVTRYTLKFHEGTTDQLLPPFLCTFSSPVHHESRAKGVMSPHMYGCGAECGSHYIGVLDAFTVIENLWTLLTALEPGHSHRHLLQLFSKTGASHWALGSFACMDMHTDADTFWL